MSKENMKKILIIVILILSLGGNLYVVGHRYIYQKGFNAGVNAVNGMILNQLQETGKLTINTENETIILVKEKNGVQRPEIRESN
jgi:hypothetical protein